MRIVQAGQPFLPANRSTDTLLSRTLLTLPEKNRQLLWQRTVDAKCENQYALASHLLPADPRLPAMRATANGRKPHKEAVCAKAFWQILATAVKCGEFRREPNGGKSPPSPQPSPPGEGERARASGHPRPSDGSPRPSDGRGVRGEGPDSSAADQPELLLTNKEERRRMNDLLNYGYAVLLSSVLQKLFGVGLDPTWGLSHAPRERCTPLAYDLMEPFRPCVDWRVFQWLRDHPDRTQWEVSKEFRKWVTAFPLERVDYLEFTLEIQGVIEGVTRGFRRAVLEDNPRYYRPWTPRNSKWAGSS